MMTRSFAEKDIAACAGLFTEVFNSEPWNDRWTVDLAIDYFQDIINTPGFEGFVLENESAIAGFILGTRKKWWSGDIYYLYEMCVNQAFQRKGAGSQLFSDAKASLAQKGFSSIVLLTERTFPAAHFYEKHGFYESPDTRFYFCSL